MQQQEVFGDAKWIGTQDNDVCPMIWDTFLHESGERATLTILGLSSFVVYINGKRAHDTYYLPLNSEFEKRNVPVGEELSFRAYPERWEITPFLTEGENVIAVFLGNGPYSDFGEKKVCWDITLEKAGKVRRYGSSTQAYRKVSFVTESNFLQGETQDYRGFSFCGDSDAEHVIEKDALETEYFFSDCPRDKIVRTVTPALLWQDGDFAVYDIGVNTTGTPIITATGAVEVLFSEHMENQRPDKTHGHAQHLSVQCGDTPQTVSLMFTWAAFRYFSVRGNARVETVHCVHAAIPIQSDFRCNDETLCWLYKAFVNTQLSNMHSGVPSDCPHLERRGYTGDGQLVSCAAMLTLDMRAFYDKWIEDIADGQDKLSGHIQYTAPYVRSGGGPGGWGCAIVVLPYHFWRYYGDDKKIRRHFDKMLRYFDFLEEHSEHELVTSDVKGIWCLGDWCTPETVLLPPPFVNTYFYIKSMQQVLEMAAHIGKKAVIPVLEARIAKKKAAMQAAYFDAHPQVQTFFGNRQGGAALGLAIGLGTAETETRLVAQYQKTGCLDTGIFGTEVLIRYLFEKGYSDLAVQLLTADAPIGFGEWRRRGLTSLPEYWLAGRPSYSHPMFGAVTACLFEYILGIRQETDTCGFSDVLIAPVSVARLTEASGHMTVPAGKIAVSYVKKDAAITFKIELPSGVHAKLVWAEKIHPLKAGENCLTLPAGD